MPFMLIFLPGHSFDSGSKLREFLREDDNVKKGKKVAIAVVKNVINIEKA
jgi:hypothetical protein